jgi:hypothetical protein
MEMAADQAPPLKPNSFRRIAGVFVSPTETLRGIASRPDWIIPLILITLLGVAGSLIVAPRLDFATGMRQQFERQGMSEKQQDRAIKLAEKIAGFTMYFSIITTPLFMLAIAGIFMLAFRLFGGEGGFGQYFAITLYAWLPQTVKSIILTIVVSFRETVRADHLPMLVKSNLSFLVDGPNEAPVTSVLLSSLDVFTFWTLFLMVLGYGFASRMKKGTAAGLVVGIWVFIVLARVVLAALQGAAG